MIGEETLDELDRLSEQCDPGPWTAVVEGRDAESGDSFIRTGPEGLRGEDLYVSRDSGPAPAPYLDLLAAARTQLPLLVAEVRAWRSSQNHRREPGPSPRPTDLVDPGEPRPDRSSPIDPRAARAASLVLPPDFDDYGWEVESKGVFLAEVHLGARRVEVSFYDRTRLAQDVEAEMTSGRPVSLERLVVVESVTVENMRRAVRDLPQAFFEAL